MKKSITLIFLFISISLFCQTNDTILNTENKGQNIEKLNTDSIYEILYNQTEKENSRIQEIFLWSMGSIIIIIIAIFGSNIFFNFRFNKKELENLTQQIDLKIQKITEESIESLKASQNNYQEKIENNLKETEKEFQNLLKSFNENYSQQINNLNGNTAKQIETLQDSFNKQLSLTAQNTIENFISVKKEINQGIKSNNLEISKLENKIKRDLARVQAHLWDGREVFSNSLTSRMDELEILIKNKHNLDFYLNDLIENLEKVRKLSKYDHKKLLSLIDKIDSETYKEKVEKIKLISENKLE